MTPTSSVAALQARLIRVLLNAEAERLAGAVGGLLSGSVVALATVEYGPRFPAASFARTRYEYEVDGASPGR